MINPTSSRARSPAAWCRASAACCYEHFVYDDDGNPLTTTFLDYLLPTAAEVPIDRVRPHRDARHHPGRPQGHGRGRRDRRAAAVVNAVNDALALVGAFAPEAPFSPSRIVAALEAVGR